MNNKKEHTIGIDIGTSTIKIVIAENASGECGRIIHNIESPTQGIRKGYINDVEQATTSLQRALLKAEKIYKQKIKKARFSIGGISLESQYIKTSIDVDQKSGEVEYHNVEELIRKSENLFTQKYPNKKILHIIPIKYRVNHRDVLGSPVGMYGEHLEVKILFITVMEHHYEALLNVINNNNIDIEDIVASPIADAAAIISYKQKTQGALLLNIGSETTSFATFENGNITSLEIFPIGSSDVTNDIALGLQVNLETAEDIKKQKNKDYPKRKTEEIVAARIADILELAEKHLIRIKKNRMLPAGIIFSGAGSQIDFIEDYAKNILKLSATTAQIMKQSKKTKRNINIGAKYSIAHGLSLVDQNQQTFKKGFSLKNFKQQILYLFKQINP